MSVVTTGQHGTLTCATFLAFRFLPKQFINNKSILYQPFNLYNNTAYTPNWDGNPGTEVKPGQKCNDPEYPDACVELTKPENIIGLQCSSWSETLMSDDETLMAIFPRIYACAERAYNPR